MASMEDVALKRIMELTGRRVSCSELLFFIAYIPLLAYLVFETSLFSLYIEKYWKAVFVIAALVLFLKEVLYESLRLSELRGILIVAVFSAFIIAYSMGPAGNSIVFSMLLLFCARKIKFERIAKISLIIISLSVAVICISAYCSVIPRYMELGVRNRDYLGFRYVLYGPLFVSNCTNLWIYNRKQKMTLAEAIALLCINSYFYIKTNARLSFFLTAGLIIVMYIIKNRVHRLSKHRWLCTLMVASFGFSGIGSFVVTKMYSPSRSGMAFLNSVLGNRLHLGKKAIDQYGFTLFGNRNMKLVGNGLDIYGNRTVGDYNYVDCLYLQLLLRYGILFFLLLMMTITYAMYRSYVSKDMHYLCIMTMIALHCMIDDLPQYFYYNSFWIAIGGLIYIKRDEKACAPLREHQYQTGKRKDSLGYRLRS